MNSQQHPSDKKSGDIVLKVSGKVFSKITESKVPDVFVHPEDPNTLVWRYMDFAKFISMLENQGIFFARTDQLGDRFEGSVPLQNRTNWKEHYEQIPLPETLKKDIIDDFSCTNLANLKWMFVNCWHMNHCESAAMWKNYAQSDKAICVQSTFAKLKECLSPSESIDDVQLSVVRYLDYDAGTQPEGNIYFPFLHKRESFAHEKELRAIIHIQEDRRNGDPPEGLWRHLDLGKLIERIYVAPTSPKWFVELVHQVVKKYCLGVDIYHSSLDKDPVY